MTSHDPHMAEALSDLNMFYIRQIGASLKKHEGLQAQIELEIKIRDGAARLVKACTNELQLLDVVKTLHASNTRTHSYMTRLQQLKASEMMEAIMDEPGYNEDTRICSGKIAISDIRIPLMWKDIHPTNKAKDQNRHAIFCLITVGAEVQDSEMVCVDKSSTDISFRDIIVFEKANYDFGMTIDVFGYPVSSKTTSNAQQKFKSKFSKSSTKEEKKLKEYIKGISTKGFKSPPLFEKIGSLKLTLRDVADTIKSHDLYGTNQHQLSLPVYENITCRLAAQPSCVTDISLSGFLRYQEITGKCSTWFQVWSEVKSGLMKIWRNEEEKQKKPDLTIDLLPNVIKITEIGKSRQKRVHSFQISRKTEQYTFAAEDETMMIKWIRLLRNHKNDMGAWGSDCFGQSSNRSPMKIGSNHNHRSRDDFVFDPDLRNTLLYKALGLQNSLKRKTKQVQEVVSTPTANSLQDSPQSTNNDAATSSSSETLNYIEISGDEDKTSFPNDNETRPQSKLLVSSPNDLNESPNSERLASRIAREVANFTFDTEEKSSINHLQGFSRYHNYVNMELPKPPLPKAPPPKHKIRLRKQESSFSSSSLDGVLEEKIRPTEMLSVAANSKSRPERHSYENIHLRDKPVLKHAADRLSYESLLTNRSSQSSGYRSETEHNTEAEKIWVRQQVDPTAPSDSNEFGRTQSLDDENFCQTNAASEKCCSVATSRVEKVNYEPPPGYRPRTNTVPQASPKVRHASSINRMQPSFKTSMKPVPTPRKFYPKISANQSVIHDEPVYDDPSSYECDLNLSQLQEESSECRLQTSSNGLSDDEHRQHGPVYARVNKQND